jgi:hypothetical protein
LPVCGSRQETIRGAARARYGNFRASNRNIKIQRDRRADPMLLAAPLVAMLDFVIAPLMGRIIQLY